MQVQNKPHAEPSDALARRRAIAESLRAPASPQPAVSRPYRESGFDRYLRAARAKNGFNFDMARHFATLGEQLLAVFQFEISHGRNCDRRLVRAPAGASESDQAGSGFLVQTDFAAAIFAAAHDMGEILPRVDKISLSRKANGLKFNAIDETSRATGSRWGGVQSQWMTEGNAANPSNPKLRRVELDLKKLVSVMYATDELLASADSLTAVAGQAFAEEIMFMTEDAIFEGTGCGQPLGVLNSPALLAAEQPVILPDPSHEQEVYILREDVIAMTSMFWRRGWKDAVWLANPELEPQILSLALLFGLAGAPVFLPPRGYSVPPYSTLFGRPIIVSEYCNAPGTPGDILLADLSQYALIDKGGVDAATSMHVAFLTDEQVFRITYRVDGRPKWTQPLTRFKGATPVSPFVCLAQR